MQTITDMVFDYRGTLLDWRPEKALAGQYPPGVVNMFLDPADPEGFWHYDELANQGMGEEEILRRYEIPHGPAVAWVFRRYFTWKSLALYDMTDGMPALLRELNAQGVRLWGLTNNTIDYVQLAQEKFPWLRLLQSTMVSADEGVTKPETEIFQRALTQFELDPKTTLFVDDSPANVEAARSLGLRATSFTGAENLRLYLEDCGLLTSGI